jgi:6-methylsalicylate decarboxylase
MTIRIDIHHHAYPPEYVAACRSYLGEVIVDFGHVLGWTPEQSIAELDLAGYDRAILSISAPGVWFGDDAEAVRLARLCNDYLADVKRTHPGRLGFFATLPMPDPSASVTELRRSLDELGADGVCFMTSYGDRWLGDASFQPVFAELEERAAAAFVHPVVPARARGMVPGLPDTLAEFAFDTTRAVASLLYGGVMSSCPHVRFVFCHGGGAMPMLLDRLTVLPRLRPEFAAAVPEGVVATLSRQFYDIASMGQRACMAALREVPGLDQLVLASDYPFRPVASAGEVFVAAGLSPLEREAIEATNPQRLMRAA